MDRNKWWKNAVVYQIYPKSFQDTNGDGVGDIRGIIQRLDYIKELGANVIWLCPVYKSPMMDNGYDIADYYHVDPMFGTDEDLADLIQEAEKKEIKILMDLVVNHTSSKHEWFEKALENPSGKYGNYYIFRKGINGQPPNNLRSYFGGSVWEPVGKDDMYYFHCFAKEQPDLNWENQELRQEIYHMINYWLDKGIAGFRIDAIGNIKKNFEKNHYQPDGEDGLSYAGDWIQNQPGIEKLLKELDDCTFRPHNSMTVAEVGVPEERLEEFIGKDGFFRMVFDFSYADIDVPDSAEWYKPTGWTIADLRKEIFHSQCVTQDAGWGCVYLENHDQPRSVNKYIKEEDINYYSKTMLAMLFLCLRGTPFIYQGQEIGMTNIRMETLEDYNDIATIDQYERALNDGVDKEEAWNAIYRRSRDNSRTPMQWDSGKNAGFSDAEKTWLKVNPNYKWLNVEAEKKENQSVLHFYKKLIKLRRESRFSDLLVNGDFQPHEEENPSVIAYKRNTDKESMIAYFNFQNEEEMVDVPAGYSGKIIGNYMDNVITEGRYRLRPYECIAFYKGEVYPKEI